MNAEPARESIALGLVAHARSGDKGDHANIGVLAYTQAGFDWLRATLTTERVHAYFHALGVTRVERFELPNVRALNFLLYDALGGGASRALRIDTQGKLLGTAVLELQLPRPDNLPAMLPATAGSAAP